MNKVHVYIAPGFEEVELVTVVDILRRAGIEVALVALDDDLAVRGAHDIVVQADLPFAAAGAAAMMVLPGGGPGTRRLRESAALADRLRAQVAAGRRVAAVCAAPTVLAAAGLLQGRQACCYPGCEEVLVAGGASIAAFNVTTDGLITTSRGAGTSALFALELLHLLGEAEQARQIGRAMLYC